MKNIIHSIIASAAIFGASTLSAAPQVFDFEDPKGVNNVRFQLDAPLESISGTGNGVSGKVKFDRSAPKATEGRIVLDAASLSVGNPLMKEHLHSEDWLDVKKHPSITFELVEILDAQVDGDNILADVSGKLTLHGVTKEIQVPVRFTYLPDRLAARVGDPSAEGDLLVIRSRFEVNRNEFGIQAGQMTDKVAEDIEISLAIAGASPRS
ncbi:MAG TPA: YceI family protein [Opitutales bacterium]|nr:YceI family protein [Opitutales bacterium]